MICSTVVPRKMWPKRYCQHFRWYGKKSKQRKKKQFKMHVLSPGGERKKEETRARDVSPALVW